MNLNDGQIVESVFGMTVAKIPDAARPLLVVLWRKAVELIERGIEFNPCVGVVVPSGNSYLAPVISCEPSFLRRTFVPVLKERIAREGATHVATVSAADVSRSDVMDSADTRPPPAQDPTARECLIVTLASRVRPDNCAIAVVPLVLGPDGGHVPPSKELPTFYTQTRGRGWVTDWFKP